MAAEYINLTQSKTNILEYAQQGLWEEILITDNHLINEAVSSHSVELLEHVLYEQYDDAMLHATRYNIREIVPSLLPHVKNVNYCGQDESYNSLLHYAAKNGMTHAINLLLAKGAYANIVNRHSQTPLNFAIDAMQKGTVQLLCSTGGVFGYINLNNNNSSNNYSVFENDVSYIPIQEQTEVDFLSNNSEIQWILNNQGIIYLVNFEKGLAEINNSKKHDSDPESLNLYNFHAIIVAAKLKLLDKSALSQLARDNPSIIKVNQLYSIMLNNNAIDKDYIFTVTQEQKKYFHEIENKMTLLEDCFECKFKISFASSHLKSYTLTSESSMPFKSPYMRVASKKLYEIVENSCISISSKNIDEFLGPMVKAQLACTQ